MLTTATRRAGPQHVIQNALTEVSSTSVGTRPPALTRRARQTERVRLKGTRFLKVATLCPCVLLFLVRRTPTDKHHRRG